MATSAYEELVERCMAAVTDRNNYSRESAVCAILAEVLRTIKYVRPEMIDAGAGWGFAADEIECIEGFYHAILDASPLSPPVQS
jgi:hypothetical protein